MTDFSLFSSEKLVIVEHFVCNLFYIEIKLIFTSKKWQNMNIYFLEVAEYEDLLPRSGRI